MRNILILGAGKSSIALIDYLVKHAQAQQWHINVADITFEQALLKTKGRENTYALGLDLTQNVERRDLIAKNDIVISMLPAALHATVAKDCLDLKKNLVTPSYVSEAMLELNQAVTDSGLIFMNEMGLDPGIDHMSAMQIIDKLKLSGKTITGFESHCGGLIAPESDDNLWHYKFTWNVRNVVLAGQGAEGVHYLKNGSPLNLQYNQLFEHPALIEVEGHGFFESYPNRDSFKYINEYGLEGVKTMYRGTLRIPPFCMGWNFLVNTGLTNIQPVNRLQLIANFEKELAGAGAGIAVLMDSISILDALKLETTETVVPATVLQHMLEDKWKLKHGDKDMIVMVHQVSYDDGGEEKEVKSCLVVTGTDDEHTAMATTVGLPVAMVTKMILNGQIAHRGVLMPKYAEIYNPILAELKQYGITFNERINSKQQ